MFNALWMVVAVAAAVLGQHNPSILEDARVHPTSDGSFGFLYRTQDGIAHAAKGDPGGAVHGRFTYTDPTGLKVNFNYNAGAQAVAAKQQQQQQVQAAARPRYTAPPAALQYEDEYEQEEYKPRQARYREPATRVYQPRPPSRFDDTLPEEPRPLYRQPEYVDETETSYRQPATRVYHPLPRRPDDGPLYSRHRVPQHGDLYE